MPSPARMRSCWRRSLQPRCLASDQRPTNSILPAADRSERNDDRNQPWRAASASCRLESLRSALQKTTHNCKHQQQQRARKCGQDGNAANLRPAWLLRQIRGGENHVTRNTLRRILQPGKICQALVSLGDQPGNRRRQFALQGTWRDQGRRILFQPFYQARNGSNLHVGTLDLRLEISASFRRWLC